MAPQSANAKNVSERVEFDAEYWLVVIAHNNQPLDSSSSTVHVITHHSCTPFNSSHFLVSEPTLISVLVQCHTLLCIITHHSCEQ